jgi:alpha-beta hydrolase superfamily lysophospholipase
MASSSAYRTFSFRSRDGLDIAAYRWDPPGAPRGIVQLTHGMGEHVRRYAPLAAALNARGFLVTGQDHRGHGSSMAGEPGRIGAAGWDELVHDIQLLNHAIRAELPGLPHVVLGHSMGSFAVQQYLLDHSDAVSAAVLTGTALLDLLEPAVDLDQELDLTGFNAPFTPARTDFDWLSRDKDQVDAYIADPRCGFGLDAAATRAMFHRGRPMADPARLSAMRADLPLYVAVGDTDPANARLALVEPLIERYRAAGLTDLTFKAYPGARHELFNEINRDEVVTDLLNWLEQRT